MSVERGTFMPIWKFSVESHTCLGLSLIVISPSQTFFRASSIVGALEVSLGVLIPKNWWNVSASNSTRPNGWKTRRNHRPWDLCIFCNLVSCHLVFILAQESPCFAMLALTYVFVRTWKTCIIVSHFSRVKVFTSHELHVISRLGEKSYILIIPRRKWSVRI